MSTQPALVPPRWTYTEFARLPDDGNRYEIIAGELHMTPAPRPFHQEIVGRLMDYLRPFARRHRLGAVLPGPVDLLFAEGDYLEPDLVFVRRERLGIITERGIEGAPELVIEVLSSSTTFRDRGIKRERYAHFGVQQYWIVDPDQQRVEVYRMLHDPLEPELVTDAVQWKLHPTAPELSIPLAKLFREFA